MKNAAQLEKAVLNLPAAERAHVALAAWASLEADPSFAASRTLDPEGIVVALERDRDIESGAVVPLSHGEFRQRTGGAAK